MSSKKIAKKAMRSKKAQTFSMAVPSHQSYEVEDAARTMERHAEVQSNKPLHQAAKKHLKKKLKNLKKVVGQK